MKSRAPLVLMELVVMVLVFALASALCLHAFALSREMGQRSLLEDEALLLAQNAAETLKLCRGDFADAAQQLGGHVENGQWTLAQGKLRLEVCPVTETIAGLGRAQVQVLLADDPLVTLPVAWQEVAR